MIEHWIWLTEIKGLGVIKQNKLINYFGNAEEVYNASNSDLENCIGSRYAALLHEQKNLGKASEILKCCNAKEIEILTKKDKLFPKQLNELHGQPILLYCKGIYKNYDHAIGVVGARKCSNDDKRECIKVIENNKSKDVAIISGMAIGIDGYAHTAAIKNNLYTIAVLGGGIDICYPDEHKNLYQRIADEGLLLSEYAPGVRPSYYNFPKRNRIIAALSNELYIIGAKFGSGSLITAEYGNKYNVPIHKINCLEDAKD